MTSLRCGEETFAPVVRRQGETFEVEVGERTFRFTLTEGKNEHGLDERSLYISWAAAPSVPSLPT